MQLSRKQNEYIANATHRWNIKSGAVRSGKSYVDTAFMPMSDLQKLVEEGLTDRILFGTDAPINKVFFKEIDTSMYIRDTINQTYKILGDKADGIFSRCIYGE